MNIETEARLLRTITRLIETTTFDTSLAVCNAGPRLAGLAGLVARLAVDEINKQIMEGQLNLYQVSGEELELCIALAVSLAAGKVVGSRLVSVPKVRGGAPSAPDQKDPSES